ncbi:hypothetical protein PybrP1_002612 [[Pythium] brassicae (nom. inval.)]|nr:hypothetical protein PybrP1_002612 [[Pythium] brassicae (nom. inval.)]
MAVSFSVPAARWALACLVALLALLALSADVVSAAPAHDEGIVVDSDAGLNVKQIVQKRGYDIEEHKVVTADRYILTMFRLPKSYDETQRNVSAAPNKPAVYLIHDAGYDVWLGNNRGTTWSPMINYVLNVSKRPTLSYIGHSEGTMQAFAGFSANQEVARRVSYFGALAPVAYLGGVTSPVFVALAETYVDKLVDLLGVNEFFGKSPIIQDVIGKFGCAFVDEACDSIINLLTGPSENVNKTRIHVYISQTPAGTSNKAVYGTFEPPEYDLSKMKYPRTAFFTGQKDWLATSSDTAKLRVRLPAGTIVSEKSTRFNHLDFTWASNANDLIYKDIIAQVKQFEGKGY